MSSGIGGAGGPEKTGSGALPPNKRRRTEAESKTDDVAESALESSDDESLVTSSPSHSFTRKRGRDEDEAIEPNQAEESLLTRTWGLARKIFRTVYSSVFGETPAPATGFANIPKDVRKHLILTKFDLPSLFVIGQTSRENAQMALEEIHRRHPNLLQITNENLNERTEEVERIIAYKILYETIRGQQELLHALNEKDQALAGFNTLPEALARKDLINPITNLFLINCDGGPMRLPEEIRFFSSLETLEAQGCNLTRIPPEIGQCKALKKLNASNNKLIGLPNTISGCSQLVELDIHGNQLTALPTQIGACVNLRQLSASHNALRELPTDISSCKALRKLDVSGNKLTGLPPELAGCSLLEELDVSTNNLEEVPDWISQCKALTVCTLHHNNLTQLPEEIGNCSNLRKLDVSDNQLTELPRALIKCTHLEELNIGSNNLREIPLWLNECPSLKTIVIRPISDEELQKLRPLFPNIEITEWPLTTMTWSSRGVRIKQHQIF